MKNKLDYSIEEDMFSVHKHHKKLANTSKLLENEQAVFILKIGKSEDHNVIECQQLTLSLN